MLRIKENQCIVISGESGSGKTESTNFLLHHFTTLSQKGSSTGSTVEKTLLSAGPVLEVCFLISFYGFQTNIVILDIAKYSSILNSFTSQLRKSLHGSNSGFSQN